MRKRAQKQQKHTNTYYIIYERDGQKGYIASAPAIPGCVVYGKTIKEAHTNIRHAIQESLEVIHDFHKKLPKETVQQNMIKKFSFVSTQEYVKT
ncbi:MAG: type II toxin-antitoxin system HicB family antitoxin [Candidatus Niyogibacteria bacterium]|nr:type II toxin-antitoxin system HicB family antitoxin [Candidatus Niyogibacteria bacterium]